MISNVQGVPTGMVVSALRFRLMFPDADRETRAAWAGPAAKARTVANPRRAEVGSLMDIRITGRPFGLWSSCVATSSETNARHSCLYWEWPCPAFEKYSSIDDERTLLPVRVVAPRCSLGTGDVIRN